MTSRDNGPEPKRGIQNTCLGGAIGLAARFSCDPSSATSIPTTILLMPEEPKKDQLIFAADVILKF